MNKVLTTFAALLLLTAADADAVQPDGSLLPVEAVEGQAVRQSDGMTLSQAVESIRRRGNVERIVSAQTRVENGREVHHIRYMTKDGKVRTAKINGRRR